jgi:hypothetical protein
MQNPLSLTFKLTFRSRSWSRGRQGVIGHKFMHKHAATTATKLSLIEMAEAEREGEKRGSQASEARQEINVKL